MNITNENVKKLIGLLDAGHQPVIRILNLSESVDYDKNMQCRCVSYADDSMGDKPDDLVLIIETDFSEFVEYNKALERPIWGSKQENQWVKWSDSVWYPQDHKVKIFLGNTSGEDFEIVENNPIFDKFLESGESNYVLWLENLVKENNLV